MLQVSNIRELLRLIGKENFEFIISRHKGERDTNVKMEIEKDIAEKLLRNLDRLQPIIREADLLYNEMDSLSFYMNRMPPQAADYFIHLPNSTDNGLAEPYYCVPHISFSSNSLRNDLYDACIGFLLNKETCDIIQRRRGRHTTRMTNVLKESRLRELFRRYNNKSYSTVKIFSQDKKEVREIEYLPTCEKDCYLNMGSLFDVSHLIIPISVDDFNFFDFNY